MIFFKTSYPKVKIWFLFVVLIYQTSICMLKGQNLFAPHVSNPFGLSGVDMHAVPKCIDIDDDGDLDMFVGNLYGDIYYFENTGNPSVPNFESPVVNPFNLNPIDNGGASPAFCDLDSDGDIDMLCANALSHIFYFENTGTNQSPNFATPVMNPFNLDPSSHNNSRLQMIDLDNDEDYDLFISNYSGNTYFYENIGTSTAPSFASWIRNPYGITDVGQYAASAFSDLDHDGDQDLLIGRTDGKSFPFVNIGSNASPQFNNVGPNLLGLEETGSYFIPEFADIDNDGDDDVFIGIGDGTIRFQKYCATYATINVKLIEGETYVSPSGKYSWIQNGIYHDTIPNAAGCDSLITINLTLVDQLDLGLLAHYSFENNFTDQSGNENHGSGNNINFVSDKCNNSNEAVSFNAEATSYISVGTNLKPSKFPVSFSFWLKADDIQTKQWIFRSDKWIGGDIYAGINLRLYNGALQVSYGNRTGAGPAARRTFMSDALNYDTGQWHHFVVNIISQFNFELFVDNVSMNGTYSGSANSIKHYETSVGHLGIGMFSQEGLTGKLDDFRVYERALTTDEVEQLFNLECVPTKVEDTLLHDSLSLFPNPAQSHVTIQSNNDRSIMVRVYNLSGKMVLSDNVELSSGHVIDLSGLTKGMYLVRLYDGKNTTTHKLVIN
ncbi:MAG: FG-GAP-like repeat-containing protein [Carboxylicivirga sp.]|jgi:hypothetical protein|nr:FG-GAP-like repeat-containing protein [Carboxylicivirga sp.]